MDIVARNRAKVKNNNASAPVRAERIAWNEQTEYLFVCARRLHSVRWVLDLLGIRRQTLLRWRTGQSKAPRESIIYLAENVIRDSHDLARWLIVRNNNLQDALRELEGK